MADQTMYQMKQKPSDEEYIELGTEEKQEEIDEMMKEEDIPMWYPDEDDTETLKYLLDRHSVMDESRPILRDGDLRYAQFVSRLYHRKDGMANINQPIEFATIENKMADELSQKPIVTLLPQTKDDVLKVSVLKPIWDYVWNEADTDEELFDHFLCKNIFGTSFWFEGLERETFTRHEPKLVGSDGKVEMKCVTETITYLKGKALDIRDVWVDPVYSLEVAEDCFIRQRDVGFDELQQLINDPNYDKQAILSFLSTRQGKADTQNASLNNWQGFMTETEKLAGRNEKFALMHYYNKRNGIYIVTDEDFTFIFRYGVNPYPHGQLPISVLQDHKNYRSIYGRGECELLESTKYERNMIRNQILDYVKFSNTINVAVGPDITFEDQELIGGVARVWNFTGDVNQVQYMKPPQQDSGLFQVDDMLAKDATWITGIDNNSLIGSPSKTAFEARLQEQQKLKRIFMSLRLADFFYTRMGRQRLANIQFFLPFTTGKKLIGNAGKYRTIALQDVESEDVIGVNDKGQVEKQGVKLKNSPGNTEFLELTPKMIKSNIDILVTTPSTTPILRDLNRAEMQELLNLLVSLAQFPTGQKLLEKFNVENYAEDAMNDLGMDAERYLGTGDETTPEDDANMMQEIMGDIPMPPQIDTPPAQNQGAAPMGMPPQPAPQGGMPPAPVRGGAVPAGM